jgi:hypothetical protein
MGGNLYIYVQYPTLVPEIITEMTAMLNN